jgi:hypothetical protein
VEYLQGLFDVKTLLIGGPFTDIIGAVAIIIACVCHHITKNR